MVSIIEEEIMNNLNKANSFISLFFLMKIYQKNFNGKNSKKLAEC